jgi:hypothetical protein
LAAFPPLLAGVCDPRRPAKIFYSLPSLLFTGVLLFVCRLGARRQVSLLLRTPAAAEKLLTLFGVDGVPHGDTLENLCRRLDVGALQEVVARMPERLIRKKVLYPYRLLDRWYVVAVDGTGTVTYHRRHCPHCLTRTHQGSITYYHNVLEAKLVTPNGLALSLWTEFIENPGEHPTKQDCELKAFYRLAARLKARFPRLPILLSMDGLFAGGPVFDLCRTHGWGFMVVLKNDGLPSVNEEFHALAPLQATNRLARHTGEAAAIHQRFRWVEDIAYVDTAKREHTLAVIECVETTPDATGVRTSKTFRWVTACRVTEKTVLTLAEYGGRLRWKVENEGFNVQKNGGFALEHAFSNNPTSAKIFYLLLQIAHTIAQLLERGSLLTHLFPRGFGSHKNLAFRLLEAWRNAPPTPCLLNPQAPRVQIRIDSS